MSSILFLVCAFSIVLGYPTFRELIPNGHSVPNPCGKGIWEAVGHFKPHNHTFEKNFFGEAFKANGFVWNSTLCQKDSDQDGKTNGEELGDPNCIWHPKQQPVRNATGHPDTKSKWDRRGQADTTNSIRICEPIASDHCRNIQGFFCGCVGFECFG